MKCLEMHCALSRIALNQITAHYTTHLVDHIPDGFYSDHCIKRVHGQSQDYEIFWAPLQLTAGMGAVGTKPVPKQVRSFKLSVHTQVI